MRIGGIAIATLLLSTVASGTQDVPAAQDLAAARAADHAKDQATDQDVVVVGRRMRLVRLDYATNGPYLRRCEARVSSGNVRVDRIMCAVLRRCVTAGYREPKPAKLCMDASIDLIVAGKRRLPEPDPVSAREPPVRSRSPLITRTAPVAAPVSGPDIVVKGNRITPTGGQWQFTKLESAGIGRPSQRRWGRCIPEGALDAMVRSMVNGEETRSADGRCGSMTLKFKYDRVTGARSCLYRWGRMKTLVRGTIGRDQLLVEETTYLVASLRRRADDGVQPPENDGFAKLYGERIGDCSTANSDENDRQSKR